MKIQAIIWSALAFAGIAAAGPITFSISTFASGTLNGVAFTDTAVTFMQVTDTSAIAANCFGQSGTFCAPASTSNTVTIGSSTYTLTDSTVFADSSNLNLGTLGIADITTGPDLLDEQNAVFQTYNMQIPLGPITDNLTVSTGVNGLATSGGALNATWLSEATFTATTSAVPEPGTWALIAIPLGFLLRRLHS